MEERFIEIRFYYYILKLLRVFRYSVHTLDIIEAYCNLGGVDSNVIKVLVRDVKDSKGVLATYREEAVYVARANNMSLREFEKESGISKSTQQRLIEYYEKNPDMYKGLQKHLDDKTFDEVYKFMRVVDIVKEI